MFKKYSAILLLVMNLMIFPIAHAATVTGTVQHSAKSLPGFNSYSIVSGGSRVQVFTHRDLDPYLGNSVTVDYNGTIDSFSVTAISSGGTGISLPQTGPGGATNLMLVIMAAGIAFVLRRKKCSVW